MRKSMNDLLLVLNLADKQLQILVNKHFIYIYTNVCTHIYIYCEALEGPILTRVGII